MDEFKLNPAVIRDGVYILTEINNEFETIYLKVREKEKRIYLDEELIKLPFASVSNPHKNEWDLRAKSFQRFKGYFETKKEELNILDLGCGNGWFCGQLSRSINHNFYCVDVNLSELTQASRVFNSGQIKFIYADIFRADIPPTYFDIIIINAAVQYFPDLKKLIDRIFTLLNANGEIHIIDSPVYKSTEVENAGQRTINYYSLMEFQEMAEHYHHHTWDELSGYNYDILFKPHSFVNRLKRLFSINDSPFPWIKISK
jgi:SAM-dependent methyltransferase